MTWYEFLNPPRWFRILIALAGGTASLLNSAINFGLGNRSGGEFWALITGIWVLAVVWQYRSGKSI